MAPGSTTDPELTAALAHALTGQALALPGQGPLAAELAAAGFDAARLQELRHQRQLERQPWPFEVDLETRRAIGFARFDAALAGARRELGLTGLTPAKPAKRRLNRDEQRLVADRPPHWG